MDFQRSDVEQELQRILTSAAFENAERSKSILAYVVDEELKGQGARINAYSIGTQVLGRPDSFDPIADTIVRVQAGRLRKTLELYYSTDGIGNPLRIALEKGNYRPSFVLNSDVDADRVHAPKRRISNAIMFPAMLAAAMLAAVFSQIWLGAPNLERPPSTTANPASHLQGPRILALPFESMSASADNDALATGLTIDTISELARFRWLTVYVAQQRGPNSELQFQGDTSTLADYRLTGQVRGNQNDLTITARLEDFDTGAILWSETYRTVLNVDDLVAVQQNIAKAIAVTIGQPGGIVGRIEQGRSLRDTAGTYAAYHCVMLTYVYWRNFDPRQHRIARDCFEKTLEKDPNYAEGNAAYAFLLLDEYRYKYNPVPGHDPIQLALKYADEAIKVDPYSALAAQARFTLAALQEDRVTFENIGHEAIRRNPNNPDLLSDFGSKLAMAFGNWPSGIALIQRSWSLNPTPPSWSYIAPATQAYIEGRCGDALALASRANSPLQSNFLLLRVACNHLLNDEPELKIAYSDMRALGITTEPEITDMIERLFLYPVLKSKLTQDVCDAVKNAKP